MASPHARPRSLSALSLSAAALLTTYVAGDAQGGGMSRIALFVTVTKAGSGSTMATITLKLEILDAAGNVHIQRIVLNDASATGAIEPTITAPSAGQSVRVAYFAADLPPNYGWKVSAKSNALGVTGDIVAVTALAE